MIVFRTNKPALRQFALFNTEVVSVTESTLGMYAFAICPTIGDPNFVISTEVRICEILHMLCGIHCLGYQHGDPRIPNIVSTPDGLRFIDNSFAPIKPPSKRRDWKVMFCSLLHHLKKRADGLFVTNLVNQVVTSVEHVHTFKDVARSVMTLPAGVLCIPNYSAWIRENSEDPVLRCDCGRSD